MKRNSQKKRNIRRSSLKQKKKVQHGGDHNFIYDKLIGTESTENESTESEIYYRKLYFVELLSKIIQKPDQVYDLLTMFKKTKESSNKQKITLGQFQNVLKTFFLTPREIEGTTRLTGNIVYPTKESNTIVEFKKNTGITTISGLQMAILYGRYELIEKLFYYKLPDTKEHSVITPDMYNSFYENITITEESLPDQANSNLTKHMTVSDVSKPKPVVANSNALHLVFTCGVNIENTPFIQSASEIAKLRHFSKMYLIKQLFHKINENWYKATPAATIPDSATPDSATPDSATPDSATPDSATPKPEYNNMKKELLSSLNKLQTAISYYKNTNAKEKLTEFIDQYKDVLDHNNADTNIKSLYTNIVNNNDFIDAINSTAFMELLSRSKPGDTESNAGQIKDNYENFFEQLEKDYLTIINHEKDNHNSELDNSKLDNSKFLEEYEKLKKENNFLPEIEVIKENNDEYVDFVIYKQFMWNETKSILLPNAKGEIIKLNDTDYKLEYEGLLKTVILPGTNKINDKEIITKDNENIGEFKKINIITLSSKPTVSLHEEFIITPIDIPEKSTSSEEESNTSDVGSQNASQQGSDISNVGSKEA